MGHESWKISFNKNYHAPFTEIYCWDFSRSHTPGKPRLIHQTISEAWFITPENISTVPGFSGCRLYTTPADSWHCVQGSQAYVQLLGNGNLLTHSSCAAVASRDSFEICSESLNTGLTILILHASALCSSALQVCIVCHFVGNCCS